MAEKTAIVQYKGEPVTITFDDIKKLVCPSATDTEAAIFLKVCQSLQLNPFAGEVFLIKYKEEEKAATVISVESYLKSAEREPNFDGLEAGIILRLGSGKLEFRQGSFLLEEEQSQLVGGWAKIYRKDKSYPYYFAINLSESIHYSKKTNAPTMFWAKEKQASMIRKVALKRALREAFPSLFAGLASNIDVETGATIQEVKTEAAPIPEDTLPKPFTKGEKVNWSKFWVKVTKELGMTSKEAHELLGVKSIQEDMVNKGKDLGTVYLELLEKVKAKKEKKDTTHTPKEPEPEPDDGGFFFGVKGGE